MNRLFSVTRRRPNLVDLYTPRESVTGQGGYRLEWSPNFDGVWTALTPDVSRAMSGYLDPAVDQRKLDVQNAPGQVRIVFDPATYTIPDTNSFWLRLQPLDTSLAPLGDPGAPTLVLPDSANHGASSMVTIAGTAPSAGDSTGSLQLDLPRMAQEMTFEAIQNLYVATEFEGAEFLVVAGTVYKLSIMGTQSSVYVRGDGATADFSLTFTLAFPR